MLDLNPTVDPGSQDVAPGVLRVPLFGGLARSLQRGGRCVILDLGPARSGMIAFCNRFRCRLDIIDLAQDLDALNGTDDPVELGRRAGTVLPRQRGDPADVVLCWDLLNYLQRPALGALMDQVATRARAGALVHVLIAYSLKRMPVQPGALFPVFDPDLEQGADAHLVSMPRPPGERDAPRYTPDDLRRCLPAYRFERGILLSNGMQELLFRL